MTRRVKQSYWADLRGSIRESVPQLTREEKQTARRLGVPFYTYAKRLKARRVHEKPGPVQGEAPGA